MGGCFQGWRRKAGGVSLGLACVKVIAWLRSQVFIEAIVVPFGKRVHRALLKPGRFTWVSNRPAHVSDA